MIRLEAFLWDSVVIALDDAMQAGGRTDELLAALHAVWLRATCVGESRFVSDCLDAGNRFHTAVYHAGENVV